MCLRSIKNNTFVYCENVSSVNGCVVWLVREGGEGQTEEWTGDYHDQILMLVCSKHCERLFITPMTKSSQFPHSSMTKYGKSDSGISAVTPSSTFPVSHGSTNGKEIRPRQEGWMPSSTLPSSFLPLQTDSIHNQDGHLPAQYSISVATNPPSIPLVCVSEKGDTWAQNNQNGCLRPSTLASRNDSAQNQVTSKPPMDPSANRRREKEQQIKIAHHFLVNPEQLPNPSSEDVVVMRSLHKERRFKKLKLLGCGGSSKVGRVSLPLDLLRQ